MSTKNKRRKKWNLIYEYASEVWVMSLRTTRFVAISSYFKKIIAYVFYKYESMKKSIFRSKRLDNEFQDIKTFTERGHYFKIF